MCAPNETDARSGQQVYAGPLAGGARAVVLLNRHDATDIKNFAAHNLTVFWESLGLPALQQVPHYCFAWVLAVALFNGQDATDS